LRGTLGCDDGREVTYELSFRADGERHLTFELSSDEPDINRSYLSYAVAEDAHILGFGAQFTHLDMQDRRVPIIVEEQGIGRGAQPITLGADLQAGAGGDAL
jgi:alpha-glucosidase